MDEQLKRRLMGATILAALMVIFVPMLFEDKSAGPAKAPEEAPGLPKTIEETPVALPQSATDVAPADAPAEAPKGKPGHKSDYKIVPMEDGPGKNSKSKAEPGGRGAGAETEEAAGTDEEPGEDVPLDDNPAGAAPAPTPGKKYARSVERPRAGVADDADDGAAAAPTPERGRKPAAGKPKQVTTAESRKPQKKSAVAEPAGNSPAKTGAGTTAKSGASKSTAGGTATKQAAPAKPGAGTPSTWSVQAGSFNSESNARALAEKLRKQNLPAYVRVIKRDSGTIYKVTVGPDLRHSSAEEIQKKVESAGGVKPIVVPHH